VEIVEFLKQIACQNSLGKKNMWKNFFICWIFFSLSEKFKIIKQIELLIMYFSTNDVCF